MAVAYVNSGVHAGATSTTVTPALPASVVAGNLLIAYCVFNNANVHSWSVGWTKFSEVAFGGGGKGSFAYRFATGSDTAPTITNSGSALNGAIVSQYSGVSGLGAVTSNTGDLNTTHTNAGFTSTAANSASLYIDLSISNSALTNPAGWTANAASQNAFDSMHTGLKLLGGLGSASGAISTTGGNWWVQWQVELIEAAPPASGTSDLTYPMFTGSITGFTGNASALTLPMITGSISGMRIFDEVVISSMIIDGIASGGTIIELDAASFAEMISQGFPGSILTADGLSSIALTSLAQAPRIFVEDVVSAAVAASTAANSKASSLTGVSVLVASTPGQAQAIYILSAQSVAALITGTQFVLDFTDGWAYNLNTGAASFYEQFKFNSFAMIDGEYFGANENGIFQLGGNLDSNDPINATITLGTTNLDTGNIKRVTGAYVGAKSAEPMLLTCRVEGEEYSYEFSRATSEMSAARVVPGRGLRGVYWQFELSNTAGADLEIDNLLIETEASSRRV